MNYLPKTNQVILDLSRVTKAQFRVIITLSDFKKLMETALFFKDLYYKYQMFPKDKYFKDRYEIMHRLISLEDEYIRRYHFFEYADNAPKMTNFQIKKYFHKLVDRKLKKHYYYKIAA